MEELFKQKEELEKQLATLNNTIEEKQNKETLISEIKNKANELESLLWGETMVRVEYFEDNNKLRITQDCDPDYADYVDSFESEHEAILYSERFDNLHETLEILDIAIKNHNIINDKLYIRDSKPLLDDYEYSFDDLIQDKIMTITTSNYVHTSFPKPFHFALNAEVEMSNTDKVKLKIHTTISYKYDIEKRYSKVIDGINLNSKYTDISECTNRSEKFNCNIEDVEKRNIYDILEKVRSLTFSNSHLFRLSQCTE